MSKRDNFFHSLPIPDRNRRYFSFSFTGNEVRLRWKHFIVPFSFWCRVFHSKIFFEHFSSFSFLLKLFFIISLFYPLQFLLFVRFLSFHSLFLFHFCCLRLIVSTSSSSCLFNVLYDCLDTLVLT